MEDRTLAGRELRQRVFNTGSQVKLLCSRKGPEIGAVGQIWIHMPTSIPV